MVFLTACEAELPARVSASLPRAFGDAGYPHLRLALTPAEARALLVGSRLLGRPLPALLEMAAESQTRVERVQRWARPYCEPRGMLRLQVHLSPLAVAEAQVAGAQFGLRCETYLVARAFELLRERSAADPPRWAFVGLPPVQKPEWQLQTHASLHLG
ncbi:MAG TPA: hypothetical protein VMH40_11885 [Myxococcaceae bacterium]|nr:hypothetical protein [Myxococcaceae bacterium]